MTTSNSVVLSAVAIGVFINAAVMAQDESVCLDALLDAVLSEVGAGRYADAAQLLENAEPQAVALATQRKGRIKYSATMDYSLQIPGISPRRKLWLSPRNYSIVPGSSDTQRDEGEKRFQEAAVFFSYRYNLHAQYLQEAAEGKLLGDVSLEQMREALGLEEDVWAGLPLEAKLRIRRLGELPLQDEDLRPADSRSPAEGR